MRGSQTLFSTLSIYFFSSILYSDSSSTHELLKVQCLHHPFVAPFCMSSLPLMGAVPSYCQLQSCQQNLLFNLYQLKLWQATPAGNTSTSL